MPKRAAIYARVSTAEGRQDPETQLRELRDYAERRGFEVVDEYVDHATGRTEDREKYKLLREQARRRAFDVVLVWRYDRFARSLTALVKALEEFKALGIDFISLQEQVDTTTPQGELIFGTMASLAQFESRLIGERVKAGMARAKAQGKRIGRRPVSQEKVERVLELRSGAMSLRKIAEATGLGQSTVGRIVQADSKPRAASQLARVL